MNEIELRKAAKCGLCGKKVGESGIPLFYRVRIERLGINLAAVRRQSGLEMMLGGSVALAQALSPEGEMTTQVMKPFEFTVCETCSTQDHCLAAMVEMAMPPDEEEKVEEVAQPLPETRP